MSALREKIIAAMAALDGTRPDRATVEEVEVSSGGRTWFEPRVAIYRDAAHVKTQADRIEAVMRELGHG